MDIKEINAGIYIFNSHLLSITLPTITNNNKQGEYYLTDVVSQCNQETELFHIVNPQEIQGINTIEQLHELENQIK